MKNNKRRKKQTAKKIEWPIVCRVAEKLQAKKRGTPFAYRSKSRSKLMGKAVWAASVRKDEGSRAYEDGLRGIFRAHALAAGLLEPLDESVLVTVFAVFAMPKSHVKKTRPETWGRKLHTSKPDGDNLLKSIKDAGEGVFWKNDKLVIPMGPIKMFGAIGEKTEFVVKIKPISYCNLRKRIERELGPDPSIAWESFPEEIF